MTFAVAGIGKGRPDYSLPYGVEQLWADTYHTLYLPFVPQSTDFFRSMLDNDGTLSINTDGLLIEVPAVNGSAQGANNHFQFTPLSTWDKERRWRCQLWPGYIEDTNIWAGMGLKGGGYDIDQRLGFAINNATVWIESGDGSWYSKVNTGKVLGNLERPVLEMRYIPGEYADFYVDEVKVGRLTEYLPSGNLYAGVFCSFWIQVLGNWILGMNISLVEFWLRR